jgi:hypothetical protein
MGVILITATFAITAASRADAAPPQGLAIALEAWKASSTSLSSGEGSGRFLYEKRNTPTEPWTTVTDARITVFFDRHKYQIRMECIKEFLGSKRMIIIHDGSAIFCSRFAPGIRPVGCEAEVYADRNTTGMVRPQAIGIPWDVSRLPHSLGVLPEIVKNVGAERINVIQTAAGDYRLTHPAANSDNVRAELDCLRQYGYNIGASRVYNVGQESPATEVIATWKKDGNVWYVDSITRNLTVRKRGEIAGYRRWQLKYDRFVPNAVVPASRFDFAALEIPGGARILDQRPGTTAPIRYVPVKDDEMEAKMDTLVEQLNSLPSTRPKRGEVEGAEGSIRWWVFVAVNVVAALTVVVLLLRLRRRKSA